MGSAALSLEVCSLSRIRSLSSQQYLRNEAATWGGRLVLSNELMAVSPPHNLQTHARVLYPVYA